MTANRPARLPAGAYEAIYAEHERDHDDGPGEPRKGCPGCALLAEVAALRAEPRWWHWALLALGVLNGLVLLALGL